MIIGVTAHHIHNSQYSTRSGIYVFSSLREPELSCSAVVWPSVLLCLSFSGIQLASDTGCIHSAIKVGWSEDQVSVLFNGRIPSIVVEFLPFSCSRERLNPEDFSFPKYLLVYVQYRWVLFLLIEVRR